MEAAASLVGGRYELETMLGVGGAGEVWRARHVTLGSRVAIKLLHASLAEHARTRERFVTEARVAAQLNTRYAVRVFDFGIGDDRRPYLVMDLLDGETLGQRIHRVGRLSPALTVRFLSQAACALSRAHALQIVHRDFKPDNVVIVLEEDAVGESIRVLDFGVAKLARDLTDDGPTTLLPIAAEAFAAALTRPGAMLGTPRYMAPEQILGSPDLDLRADVWALGVVAFECLTGEAPFRGAGLVELFANIQCGVHLRAKALVPALPARFDAWFEVACATHPSNRFASASTAAAELATALGETRAYVSGPSEPPPAAPRSTPPVTMIERSGEDRITSAAREGDSAFHEPDWEAPLDVDACLDAIPKGTTMKGLFTGPLIAEAQRRGICLPAPRDRYLPFVDYPLVDHVRLLAAAARAFYPDRPIRAGLRKLGRWAYPSFIQSIVGRVLWASVDSVEKGIDVAGQAYALATPSARLVRVESSPGRAVLRAECVRYFMDSNHVGVLEGVLRACNARGTVRVRIDSPSSGAFLLTWT